MKLLLFFYIFMIGNGATTNEMSISKVDRASNVDAFILHELGELKRLGFEKREYFKKKEYNKLAEEVNDLIDGIIICVKRGNISDKESEKLEKIIENINKKLQLHKTPSVLQDQHAVMAYAPSVITSLTLLLITIKDILKLFDSHIDKKDFIKKLQEKKWDSM